MGFWGFGVLGFWGLDVIVKVVNVGTGSGANFRAFKVVKKKREAATRRAAWTAKG